MTVIKDFLDYIFDGLPSGYIAYSFKFPDGRWENRWKRWPEEVDFFTDKRLAAASKVSDVYYCPTLFSEPTRRIKQNATQAHTTWVDLDVPSHTLPQLGPPGLVVASGSPGRTHAYWRSEKPLDVWEVERHNDLLARELGADSSGWDATQLLRLPGTLNWKTNPPTPVTKLNGSGRSFSLPSISRLSIPVFKLDKLPDVTDKLDEYLTELLQTTPVDGRGRKLYHVACYAVEHGWNPDDTRSLVDYADRRYGKFVNRQDRNQRLDEIVARALANRPTLTVVDFDLTVDSLQNEPQEPESTVDLRRRPRNYSALRKTSKPITWVVEGILRERGLLYVAGPTGVGKSTIALNIGTKLVIGSDNVLGFSSVPSEQHVLYASHEMDQTALEYFFYPMVESLPDVLIPAVDKLEFVAYGSRIALNTPKEQLFYEKLLKDGQYTGFIIDTIGASTSTTLQDETPARELADWLDRIRQKYGIWVIVLAHPRKAPQGAKAYNYTIDDMYGSRIFGDRADTVIIVQPHKGSKSLIEFRGEKTRFNEDAPVKYFKRTRTHWFEPTDAPQSAQQPSRTRVVSVDMGGMDIDLDA